MSSPKVILQITLQVKTFMKWTSSSSVLGLNPLHESMTDSWKKAKRSLAPEASESGPTLKDLIFLKSLSDPLRPNEVFMMDWKVSVSF